jgi:hypothetical protein
MKHKVLFILVSLLTSTLVYGQERPHQNPVIVYAIDIGDDNDSDLDIISEDVKMYENAAKYGLARKIVVIPITNWANSEHTFKHGDQRYSILLPSLELKKL